MVPSPYTYGDFPDEILGYNNDTVISALSGSGSMSDISEPGNKSKNIKSHVGKSSTEHSKINISTNSTIAEITKIKRPLHKADVGGRDSCFVPVVRVHSSRIVGIIQHNNDKDNLVKSNGNKKFSKLLQRWQTREERNVNAIPQNDTFEYRFRPIISEDEKYQVSDKVEPQPNVNQANKKKVKKMPVVEISFFDDESIDTLSSMGYDGSEHDLEAIFKYEIYEIDNYNAEEENYFEGKKRSLICDLKFYFQLLIKTKF